VFYTGTSEEFIQVLNKGGEPKTYIYLDDNDNQVGYLALSALDDSDAIEVRSIAVEREYRHNGFGKKMMFEAERIASQAGRNKLTLVTSPENTRALDFYKGLGYVVTNKIENYYGDGTPRYVLEKLINQE
jgi:ribosomal-protein-alanine N-acetyltransferase